MRIKAIELAWFRGAAETVALTADGKSMVVYGENGSGKSSFVDAVEYALQGGRIRHLAHEYSGKRQEKGVINTCIPDGEATRLRIGLENEEELRIEVRRDGTFSSSGAAEVGNWDYQRTVLRQDEVAAFISSTKGDKYSALLPLLGLDDIEVAAENLRQLVKTVRQQARLSDKSAELQQITVKRKEVFGEVDEEEIRVEIQELHGKYCPSTRPDGDLLDLRREVEKELHARIAESDVEQRKHVLLRSAAGLDLKKHASGVRAAGVRPGGAAEPHIDEKLEVLEAASLFSSRLAVDEDIACPACGRSIPSADFQAHVAAEKDRLEESIAAFEARKAAVGTLCDTVTSLRSTLKSPDLQSWREELEETLPQGLRYLSARTRPRSAPQGLH
jgi:DNA repair exonuclease SbcCD ATPase subunit